MYGKNTFFHSPLIFIVVSEFSLLMLTNQFFSFIVSAFCTLFKKTCYFMVMKIFSYIFLEALKHQSEVQIIRNSLYWHTIEKEGKGKPRGNFHEENLQTCRTKVGLVIARHCQTCLTTAKLSKIFGELKDSKLGRYPEEGLLSCIIILLLTF